MRPSYFLAAALLLAACEKEDNWQPGNAVPQGTHIVYFSSDNESIIGYRDGDEPVFNLTLERTDANDALTVPIVVTDSLGSYSLPSTVEFAEGEQQATLSVRYDYRPGMHLTLGFGPGYGNPYLEQDGTVSFKCNIAKLNYLCKVNYAESSKLSDVESSIYNFEGMNRFRFFNFIGSSIDLDFTVNTQNSSAKFKPGNLHSLYGDFTPCNNNYYDGEGWYLYDDNTASYPEWSLPNLLDSPVKLFFYWDYNDGNYSYIDFRLPTKDSKGNPKPYDCYFYAAYFYYGADSSDLLMHHIYYTLAFD